MAAIEDPKVAREGAALEESTIIPSEVPLAPVLGYRNYWYPLIEGRRVGSKPVAVRIVGEDFALFRTAKGVAALIDRCAHGGSRLSQGRILFRDAP
ncbi:MAG: Rieske 2Fe-2S domain-containing protein [Chloroflexi bacterium]|nr:Rieske 2Fe-2S domain-containing protein [Chloroflexota bacterium]